MPPHPSGLSTDAAHALRAWRPARKRRDDLSALAAMVIRGQDWVHRGQHSKISAAVSVEHLCSVSTSVEHLCEKQRRASSSRRAETKPESKPLLASPSSEQLRTLSRSKQTAKSTRARKRTALESQPALSFWNQSTGQSNVIGTAAHHCGR